MCLEHLRIELVSRDCRVKILAAARFIPRNGESIMLYRNFGIFQHHY